MSILTDITNTKQTRYKSAETHSVWFYLLCQGFGVASDPFSINAFFYFIFGTDGHGNYAKMLYDKSKLESAHIFVRPYKMK